MKIFALVATLAAARQRRAMTVNEQGGVWESQEAQVSNQVPQVSNQVPQVSNQVPQVSMQVPQRSNQVPQVSNQVPQVSDQKPQKSNQNGNSNWKVETCEESYRGVKHGNNKGIWYNWHDSFEWCNLSNLMRINVNAQFEQLANQFGKEKKLRDAWGIIKESWAYLSRIEYDNNGDEKLTGCGIPKKKHPQWNYNLEGFSMECDLMCKHIYDINKPEDFQPVLNQIAGIILISANSSSYIINMNFRNNLTNNLTHA